LLLLFSCKKTEDANTENPGPDPEPEKPIEYSLEFEKYKSQNAENNKTGLQMAYKDTTNGRTILFYGNFDEQGMPR
jgi:hypothetical protein